MEQQQQNFTQQPTPVFNTDSFKVQMDMVKFPSKGYFYQHKKDSVLVQLMTAKDEAILLSPQLLQSGKALDVLAQKKIQDPEIKVDDLLACDINAILMFLRISAYGADYDVNVISPYSYEEFSAVVDLNSLKDKEFNIIPDQLNEFTYTTKDKQHTIKFKFLTNKEEKIASDKAEKKEKVSGINERYLEILKMKIKEVNGDRNGMNIFNFIENSKPKIIKEIRQYIDEVEPGIDMSYMFTCPSTGQTFQAAIPITSRFFYPE